jgi:hypothetical protein
LLYAATELRVYVSFNDGAQWQPLQNNMPVTSVRDIVVHGDDLDVATYGRGFWVLDQMSALRQITAKSDEIQAAAAYLFQPGETYAIHVGGMNGTPLPHEEPQLLNPPAGVLAYYWLKTPAAGPLKIELVDGSGSVRACVASDTPVRPVDTESLSVQAVWQQPAELPSTAPGMHRIALGGAGGRRFGGGRTGAPPPVKDACTGAVSEPAPAGRGTGGLQPGPYTVRLTVDGQTYSQPVTVKPDPRNLPEGAH